MRCEVVAVGTELLLGQIVDTNSSWIGEQLALAGIDSHFQTKVGDNLARIVDVLRLALDRSDAVIVCGGLGPTHDDITRDAIAEVMGVELELDDEVAARIEAMFRGRNRRMPANNFRQAEVPVGARAISDPQPGTAPGLVCPIPWPDGNDGGGTVDKVLYAVPGVPYEMRDIVSKAILPDLCRRAGATAVIRSRTLRTWGESESGLAERLADRISELDKVGNPTLAFLASGIEGLKVRITAKAESEEAVLAVLDEEQTRLDGMLGTLVFGIDDESMEHAVLALLEARSWTLGLAESATGGLIGVRITNVPGASKVFRGGIVSYASDVKFSVLGVPEGPVVSGPAAEAMAAGARRVLGADVGLSVTGVAGPDPQDDQPPGTVFVGLAMGDEVTSIQLRLPGDRDRVRQFATISALDVLRHRLLGSEGGGHLGRPASG
jgi:nicotinamide-nucleotide amidase